MVNIKKKAKYLQIKKNKFNNFNNKNWIIMINKIQDPDWIKRTKLTMFKNSNIKMITLINNYKDLKFSQILIQRPS